MKSLVKVGVFATLCLVILGVLIWKIEDINPFGTKGQHLARRLRLGRRARRQGLGAHRRRPGRPRRRPRPRRQPGQGHHGDGEADPAHRRHHGADRQPRPARREVRRADPRPAGRGAAARRRRARRHDAAQPGRRDGEDQRHRLLDPEGHRPALDRTTSAAASTACWRTSSSPAPRSGCWSPRTAPTSPPACATSTHLTAILARELPRLAVETNRALDQISTLVQENRGNVSGSLGNIRS